MKFGICSEIFEKWDDVDRTVAYVKSVGYDGLEIAPYTLAQYVTDIPQGQRAAIRKRAEEADLEIIGLHWLLVGPEGVHLTHPDEAVRDRTARYLVDLAHCCADLGGRIMVFGSPKQRSLEDGVSYEEAEDNALGVFERALPACAERGVTICMEPLTHLETNFCDTAAKTVRLIERVNHPNFKLLLDTKAMAFEEESRAELIKRYAGLLGHYHANDENLKGPGFGEVDFGPIFGALDEIGYKGYVSVEVFNFDEGPERIAEESLRYMREASGVAA